MPKEFEVPFKAYEFSQEESELAFVFTDMQVMHIRTEAAIAATERVKLKVPVDDPNATMRFLCEQEYYRGKVEALLGLLATHEDTRTEIQRRILSEIDRTQNN